MCPHLWHEKKQVFFRIFSNLLQRPLKGTAICLFWRKTQSPDNGFIDNADYHLCWMMDLVFSWKWTTLKQQFKNYILFGNVCLVRSPRPNKSARIKDRALPNSINFHNVLGEKKTLTQSRWPQPGLLFMRYGFKCILAREQKDKPSSIAYQLTSTIWIFNINQGKWLERLQVSWKHFLPPWAC